VLVLRTAGVLIGHHVDRYCTGTERHQTQVLMEMRTGGRLVIRSVTSAPGTGQLGELYSPHLVCVSDLWFQVRGFEKHDGAGVMQEWIVFPTDAHLTARQRDTIAALDAAARTRTAAPGTMT
jgi:hypothetical protein